MQSNLSLMKTFRSIAWFYRSCLLLLICLGSFPVQALEIYVEQSFTTRQIPEARIYTYTPGKVFLRVYKIEDPKKYLLQQSQAQSANFEPKRIGAGGYAMWKSFTENFKWSLFMSARRYMKTDVRQKLMTLLNLEGYSYPFTERFPAKNLFQPLPYKLLTSFEKNVSNKESWSSFMQKLPVTAKGFYLLEVSQGKSISYCPFILSDVTMILKEAQSSHLVYLADIASNKAVAKGEVTVIANSVNIKERKIIDNGKIVNGVYFKDKLPSGRNGQILVLAESNGHYALAGVNIYNREQKNFRSVVITDRPVYRQGHEVELKLLMFEMLRGNLFPAKGNINLSIKDPTGKEILKNTVSLNKFGSHAQKIKLSEVAALGYYSVQMSADNVKQYGGFYVEQYKKPEFKVNVTSSEKVFFDGDYVKFNVSANYYSGEAIANAAVRYTIYRKEVSYPWWYGYDYWWYYGDDEYDDFGYFKDGDTKTDDNGFVEVAFETSGENQIHYEYKLEVEVVGNNRQTIHAQGKVKVVTGEHNIRLSKEKWYFSPKENIELSATVESFLDSRPVATDFTGVLYQKIYSRDEDRRKEVARISFKSDATGNGKAVFPGVQTGGDYEVEIRSKDGSNRISLARMNFWVFTPWWESSSEESELKEKKITIAPDKTKYSIFDTAALNFSLGQKTGQVLVVFETTEVAGYKIINLKDGLAQLKQKLGNEFAPNVRITAYAFGSDKRTTLYSGSQELVVPPQNKFLNVAISADRDSYRPGERGKFVIKTTNYSGQPVSGEYSLGVVDEAIYAIKEDNNKEISLKLYPKNSYGVYTSESLRYNFYSYGKEFSLFAALKMQRDQILADFKDKKRDEVTVRKNFKDTAIFISQGQTDKNGMAVVEFNFPDNLTQWRFTAHATTASGEIGSQIEKFIVKKDFALRLSLPRFIRENDRILLGAVINNQLPKNLAVNLEIQTDGLALEVENQQTISMRQNSEKRVDFWVKAPAIQSLDSKEVSITVKAVVPSVDNDGVELKIPILPYGVPRVVAQNATLDNKNNKTNFNLQLPDVARDNLHRLRVAYSGGVLPSVMETIPSLVGYPYGCVEQTLSSFVPLVQAKKLATEFSLTMDVSDKEVEKMTAQGLEKLYGYQHSDGGWGWWSDDETHAYMTAYVLYGFFEAAQAGIIIEKDVIHRGLIKLVAFASEYEKVGSETSEMKDYNLSRLAFIQYVVSLYNQSITRYGLAPVGFKEAVLKNFRNLVVASNNPYLHALAVLAAIELKDDNLKNSAAEKIAANAKKSGTNSFYFQNNENSYYWYDDKEEVTAYALRALLKAEYKDQKLAEGTVQYLLRSKNNRQWRSTKTSALIVSSLADFARQNKEDFSVRNFEVTVNGQNRTVVYDPKKNLINNEVVFTPTSKKANVALLNKGDKPLFFNLGWEYLDGENPLKPFVSKYEVNQKFYRLTENRKGEKMFYQRSAMPLTEFKEGDLVLVETNVSAPLRSEFLLLEKTLPAGFEVVDNQSKYRLESDNYYSWRNRPSAMQVFDDRVGMSKAYIYDRDWSAHLVIRAVFPGSYSVMPAKAGNMYFENEMAYNSNAVLSIVGK